MASGGRTARRLSLDVALCSSSSDLLISFGLVSAHYHPAPRDEALDDAEIMTRSMRLLALLVGLAAGELQSKKVLNYAAEINKDFMKEYQAEKAAKKAAQAEGAAAPSALEDARKLLSSKGEAPSKASEPSSTVSVSGGGRLAVLRLPAVLGLGAGAYRGLQAMQLQRLTARLRTEQSELAEMGVAAVELPEHRGGIRAKIAAHAEALRQLTDAKVIAEEAAERKAGLLAEASALYAQLKLSPPASLQAQGEAELRQSLDTLSQRVAFCAALHREYHTLGLVPPDDFRTWPLEQTRARLASLTEHAPLLSEALLLQTKLGGARSLEALVERSEAELEETLAGLRAKVAEKTARRAKETLLGKVEAALWMHKQEVPVGLASMDAEALQALLDKLLGAKAA